MLHPTPLHAALLPTAAVLWLPSGSSRSPAAHRQNSVGPCHVLNPITLPLLFAIDFADERVSGLEAVEAVMIECVVVPKSLRAVIATVHCLSGVGEG